MYNVKVSVNSPSEGLLRQSPNSAGIWGNYRFHVNSDIDKCDFWVVFSKGCKKNETARVSPKNLIFVSGEPESVYHYSTLFLRQFDTVVTSQRTIVHPNVIHNHPAQPWRIGRIEEDRQESGRKLWFTLTYDDLKSMPRLPKRKLISVITSTKAFTRGHVERIRFVNRLKRHFGNSLDVYGKGINEVADKWDAIADYRYHIALENSSYDDYWTEKLADCFLAQTFPFYYGCKNIDKYFPRASFRWIDPNDTAATIKTIETAIHEGEYEKRTEALDVARNLVLDKHNILSLIASICGSRDPHSPKELVTLRHELSYMDVHKCFMLARRLYSNMCFRFSSIELLSGNQGCLVTSD